MSPDPRHQKAADVRAATGGDREFVLDLASRLADFDLPPWRSPREVIDGDRRDLALWFDSRGRIDQAMLIAELDGRPAGVLHVVSSVDYFSMRPHGHVSVLAVSAEAEGRGVGSALLEAAAEWSRARGFERLTIMFFTQNHRAARVYERNGYLPEFQRYSKPL